MGSCVESIFPRFLEGLGLRAKVATGPSLSEPVAAACEAMPRFVHVSIDSFYASAEQQLNPKLVGKSVLVGQTTVLSASQEAILSGIKPGMSLEAALGLCPATVVVEGKFNRYALFAERVHEILMPLAAKVECGCADDFFLELDQISARASEIRGILLRLQMEVLSQTGLSVSVGAGSSRAIAATASRAEGPRGIKFVSRGAESGFLAKLPAKLLPGMEERRAAHMAEYGVNTIADLARVPRASLEAAFGRHEGHRLWHSARGRDPQKPAVSSQKDSLLREVRIEGGTRDVRELHGALDYLCERVSIALDKGSRQEHSVGVAIRYTDGYAAQQMSRLDTSTADSHALSKSLRGMLRSLYTRSVGLEFLRVIVTTQPASHKFAADAAPALELPLAV